MILDNVDQSIFDPFEARVEQSSGDAWETVVALAVELRVERDQLSFALGDVVLYACSRKTGRPQQESDQKTVSALAQEIGEDRAVLSNLASNSEFYDTKARAQIPLQISWRQAAKARKASGWIPGAVVTKAQRARALSILYRTADQAPRSLKHERTLAEQIDASIRSLEHLLRHKEIEQALDPSDSASIKVRHFVERADQILKTAREHALAIAARKQSRKAEKVKR